MSKTLEELGYEKEEDTPIVLIYKKKEENRFYDNTIIFYKIAKRFTKVRGYSDAVTFTMEELKTIYKYYEDNKWI